MGDPGRLIVRGGGLDVASLASAVTSLDGQLYDREGEPITFAVWMRLQDLDDYRIIRRSRLLLRRKLIETTWTGRAVYNAIGQRFLFQTCVYETGIYTRDDDLPALCVRHQTERQARRRHRLIVHQLRRKTPISRIDTR